MSSGEKVKVLFFKPEENNEILTSWAKHFRNHYCDDEEIDSLRDGTGLSRADFLNEYKFPDALPGLGPGIRSGDFGEIIVADYLEHILNYWVPRTRYSNKTIRNESTKGSDILGFKSLEDGEESPQDVLIMYEVKAQFTGKRPNSKLKLQEAVNHSAKDELRKAESLNAMKQRFLDKSMNEQVSKIKRFQNIEDRPYKQLHGAAALFSTHLYESQNIRDVTISNHPNASGLKLLIIYGDEMMDLVHDLYKRAANEA